MDRRFPGAFQELRREVKERVPPNLVDALDLETWANRRDAEGVLPELIFRLIHATNSRITRIHFPFGEGVRQRGADGMLIAEEGTGYVPLGASSWEVGAGGDPGRKANEDYRDRRDGPFRMSPSDAAFVFVAPRRWDRHENWAEARSAEGRWREVRAYDAHDLESWLLLAPVVHVWISRIAGKPVASHQPDEGGSDRGTVGRNDPRSVCDAYRGQAVSMSPCFPLTGSPKQARGVTETDVVLSPHGRSQQFAINGWGGRWGKADVGNQYQRGKGARRFSVDQI
jgi:hypothetical protein